MEKTSLSNLKKAVTKHPILPLLQARWSPRAFAPTSVPSDVIARLFEAASWSASSYNEQPWRFILGTTTAPKLYDKVFECLNPWNQAWAKSAPVLVLVVGKKTFSHDGSANRSASYDCGAAVASLSLQATHEDLFVHQMAGIFPEKARQLFQIPDDFEVLTALAIGYLGELDRIPAEFWASEQAPRTRKPITDLVFANNWGETAEEAK